MNQENIDIAGQIFTAQRGGLGIITLNRPDALNALSLEMIRQITVLLRQWEKDDSISCVVFAGAGERAFCAGGDVKSFYSSGMDYRRGNVDLTIPSLYFGEEYSLNQQIFHYSKPTIAIMDGIVMGGGYGIAGHCKHRVVTNNSIFAMPEVGIGFFPDVGAVYHLLKSPRHYGRYLALTGTQIGAGDILAADLADFYVESEHVEGLINSLVDEGEQALHALATKQPEPRIFDDYGDAIYSVFADFDITQICSRLRDLGTVWATETLGTIMSQAPLSVLVTAKHLDAMQGISFDGVIEADYQLAQRFIAYPDLYEGIRAALIDRDNNPVWEPETLDGVKPEDVERYFQPAALTLADI